MSHHYDRIDYEALNRLIRELRDHKLVGHKHYGKTLYDDIYYNPARQSWEVKNPLQNKNLEDYL